VSTENAETTFRKVPINSEVERSRNVVNILPFVRGGEVVGVRLQCSRRVADRRHGESACCVRTSVTGLPAG
jgi:hypothetical protein